MRDPARIQAAIEILDQVAESLSSDGPSADVLIRKYFRTRRYAGSKDRRAVTGLVYDVIRDWGFLRDMSGGDIRRMLLLSDPQRAECFTGQEHAPAKLTAEERAFLDLKHNRQPRHRLNYPEWLEGRLTQRFTNNFEAELESLNGRASFDLRVNAGKATVAEVETFLKDQGVDFSRGKWTDSALKLTDNLRIDGWDIYKNGAVEIQDEAAQLAAFLADARPGQQVMDLCAGAGGKTLAMAAHMENRGQIYAFDNDHSRLKDLKPRAKRANIRILQCRHVDTAGGKREKILSEYMEKMDRVVLDVPCSGSGVWRRNPELKWRLDEDSLTKYVRIQKSLMREAWGFVKTGGRLIYMTCSLFYDENEQQVTDFLAAFDNAGLISYRDILGRDILGRDIYDKADLKTLSALPECLALSPRSHGTDGFFVAIIEKTKPA